MIDRQWFCLRVCNPYRRPGHYSFQTRTQQATMRERARIPSNTTTRRLAPRRRAHWLSFPSFSTPSRHFSRTRCLSTAVSHPPGHLFLVRAPTVHPYRSSLLFWILRFERSLVRNRQIFFSSFSTDSSCKIHLYYYSGENEGDSICLLIYV